MKSRGVAPGQEASTVDVRKSEDRHGNSVTIRVDTKA